MDGTLITNGLGDFLFLAATEAESGGIGATLLGWLGTLLIILKVAAGLGFVIFVHELGHFLVAKACGVKCDKFYIGFDVPISKYLPAKLFHFTYGETEYGIGIIPLGGYVKMLGQDDDPRNMQAEAERTKINAKDLGEETAENIQTITNAISESAMNPPEHPKPKMLLDPRSFPAKSIPARMAIISAGVIMNVIFAVILGAVAFMMGVPYMPAAIGTTVAGSPAWKAGLQPGDKVLQFGKSGSPSETLRWEDLMRSVMFNGDQKPLSMLVRRADGTEEWFEVQPVQRDRPGMGKKPSVGVSPLMSTTIGVLKEEAHPAETSAPLKTKDVVKKIDGEEVKSSVDLLRIFARKPGEALNFEIERPAPDDAAQGSPPTVEQITVEPRPLRSIGVVVKGGGVVGVQAGSLAERAGIKVDETVVKINGDELGDLVTIAQRMLPLVGQDVTLTVQSNDKTPATREVVLPMSAPQAFDYFPGGPIGIQQWGLALATTFEVAEVIPDSPAAAAGLKTGDVLVSAQVENEDEKKQSHDREFIRGAKEAKPYEFSEDHDWLEFSAALQVIHSDSTIALSYRRGDKIESAKVTTMVQKDVFHPLHGLRFQTLIETRKTSSPAEAVLLGARETRERMGEVLLTLASLGTGKISLGDLGGPLMIFTVAGGQAKQGISSLLMFLVLLSANLAIINFLPIPALDGGHMMFLTAEWLRGKPVDPELQMKLTIGGVLGLLSLMLFVTVMDVNRLIQIFS